MGNGNGRESVEGVEDEGGVHCNVGPTTATTDNNNQNDTPAPSKFPFLVPPPVPIAPLQTPFHHFRPSSLQGIPTIITWTLGGNDVSVEGSWDNWASRKNLQRSGTDQSILLVLPPGIHHYRFVVDGEMRYVPDLPFMADEMGNVCNVLDVNDYVPEVLDSVVDFEAPLSPDSTYSQAFPSEDDFAKEPVFVPPQLHLTDLGKGNPSDASSSKPEHCVLNHLFIEKGWASQSLVALGVIHRFQSKYVTVRLYKPLKR